jgi:hypothetical protein
MPAIDSTENGNGGVGGDVENADGSASDINRGADVDPGGDRDLSNHVKPGGQPAPAASAETERPIVEAARGWIGGGEFGHGGGDAESENADNRPADGIDNGAGEFETVTEQENGAGENGDDGKGNGEIGEAAHFAEELLGVAELGQIARVLLNLLIASEFGLLH